VNLDGISLGKVRGRRRGSAREPEPEQRQSFGLSTRKLVEDKRREEVLSCSLVVRLVGRVVISGFDLLLRNQSILEINFIRIEILLGIEKFGFGCCRNKESLAWALGRVRLFISFILSKASDFRWNRNLSPKVFFIV